MPALKNLLTLRFPSDDHERQFRAEYARAAVRPARATTVLVIALYLGYFVVDIRTGMVDLVWPYRIAVALVMGGVLALTWRPIFVRAHSWILSVGALTAAFGLLAMMSIARTGMGVAFYPAIGMAMIGTLTLFRIRFPVAFADAVLMLIAYVVLLATGDYPDENRLFGILFLVSSLLLGAFAGWFIERYARQSFLARKGLEEERGRSEKLLLNVLPQTIAERLKTDPAPIADRFPEASILFADVVGFTAMCGRMEPEDLVTFLNELFTGFDHVAEKHGLEKIKTIGDAYMAVAGVPEPCADHLERIAAAALEMRELVGRRGDGAPGPSSDRGNAREGSASEGGGGQDVMDDGRDGRTGHAAPPLAVRFGIDTGPVVAGVIGEKKFIYDLWGDAVTMASRMETHGVAGAIQVTEAVRERLNGRFALERRGRVEVKGRGVTETYWLLGAVDSAAGQDLPVSPG